MNKYQFYQFDLKYTITLKKKINLDQSNNFSFPKFSFGKIFSQFWEMLQCSEAPCISICCYLILIFIFSLSEDNIGLDE